MSTPEVPRKPDEDQAVSNGDVQASQADAAGDEEERIIGLTDILGREAGGLLVLLVLVAALTVATPDFLTGTNLANLVR